MKVRSSLKITNPKAFIVKRRGILYMICKDDPNVKSRMKGRAKRK